MKATCSVSRAPFGLVGRHWACALLSCIYTSCMTVFPKDPIPIAAALTGHEAPVASVSFSPDGTRLASASFDGTVLLWDVSTHEPAGPPIQTGASVHSIAFSPSGEFLAAGNADNELFVWRVANDALEVVHRVTDVHTRSINKVVFSHDGRLLASGGSDHTAVLTDTSTWKPLFVAPFEHEVRSLAFSPRGETLAVVTDRETITLDLATSARTGTPMTVPRAVLLGDPPHFADAVYSPGGSLLATVGAFPTAGDVAGPASMLLWDLSTRRVVASASAFWGLCVAFSPDGRTIVIGAFGGFQLWDVSTRELLPDTVDAHGGGNIPPSVHAVAFSPDGTVMASAGGARGSSSIVLWDVATWTPIDRSVTRHGP